MQRWVRKSICDGGVGNPKAAAQRFSSTTECTANMKYYTQSGSVFSVYPSKMGCYTSKMQCISLFYLLFPRILPFSLQKCKYIDAKTVLFVFIQLFHTHHQDMPHQ